MGGLKHEGLPSADAQGSANPGLLNSVNTEPSIFDCRRRRTAQVMVQMWCVAIPVGFGGVQMVAQLRGVSLESLTPADPVCHSEHVALHTGLHQICSLQCRASARIQSAWVHHNALPIAVRRMKSLNSDVTAGLCSHLICFLPECVGGLACRFWRKGHALDPAMSAGWVQFESF